MSIASLGHKKLHMPRSRLLGSKDVSSFLLQIGRSSGEDVGLRPAGCQWDFS
jgi:hypothetical protein